MRISWNQKLRNYGNDIEMLARVDECSQICSKSHAKKVTSVLKSALKSISLLTNSC